MSLSPELVLATGNAGKVREMQALLDALGWQVAPQSRFGIPEADETGLGFIDNALIKARHAARHTGLPALADDSGLACDALDGAPGIYSARYAGPKASDASNIEKLLGALAGVAPAARTCRFFCAIAFVRHAADPCPIIAEGAWEGRVALAPRGTQGFGYDPVFEVVDLGLTAAELDPATKQRLSHRGQALARFIARLTDAGAQRSG